MANINLENSRPSLVSVPVNYPKVPTPGKISLLFDANSNSLYHKYNPNNYDNGDVLFGSSQPYIYKEIGDRSLGGRGLPLEIGLQDVVRVSKFIGSGRGLLFVGKQFLLQGQAIYDECNFYNPTEVILSATANMGMGLLDRPKRHIDTSGGLLGGLASLVGIGVSRGNPPPSTVAAGDGSGGSTQGSLFSGFSLLGNSSNRETEVLPVQNYGDGTGLLRAKTANKARSILQAKWGVSSGDSSNSIFGFITGIAKSIIPQVFGSDKQNYKQRADDQAYNWMIKYYNNYTAKGLSDKSPNTGLSVSFMGLSLKNPSSGILSPDKANQIGKYSNERFTQFYKKTDDEVILYSDNYNKSVISTPEDDSNNENSKLKTKNKSVYKSDIRPGVINKNTVSKTNTNLQKVLTKIKESGIYTTTFDNDDTFLFSSGNPSKNGYDRLYDISKDSNDKTGLELGSVNSIRMAYKKSDVRTLDSIFNDDVKRNYGFAGSGRPDRINTLTVLDKDKTVKDQLIKNYTEWKPYEDDLIVFFFYDVVNERYIPFRATVKGISESNNALWDPLRFMGRADEIYSYTGFTRNLSFSFTVVVNSLVELYPVWKRINYLASSVKPSNYTNITQKVNIPISLMGPPEAGGGPKGIVNRFIIPPMFMLTIGDLYKYQPIVINSVVVNIPENAIWETFPENSTEKWSYLSKIIGTTVTNNKIGQVPREAEISITCNVLEKERPIVGGNHFGHCPVDDVGDEFYDPNNDSLPKPSGFSRNLRIDSDRLQKVVDQVQSTNLE